EVELLLRFSIAANDAHGYEILWGLTGYIAIVRWEGPLGYYTPLFDPGEGPTPRDGDVMRAEISGNVVTVTINGQTMATVDVSTVGDPIWTTGQPGIGFWPGDGAVPENYCWKTFEAGALQPENETQADAPLPAWAIFGLGLSLLALAVRQTGRSGG